MGIHLSKSSLSCCPAGPDQEVAPVTVTYTASVQTVLCQHSQTHIETKDVAVEMNPVPLQLLTVTANGKADNPTNHRPFLDDPSNPKNFVRDIVRQFASVPHLSMVDKSLDNSKKRVRFLSAPDLGDQSRSRTNKSVKPVTVETNKSVKTVTAEIHNSFDEIKLADNPVTDDEIKI